MKKTVLFSFILLFSFLFFLLPVSADDADREEAVTSVPDEYGDFLEQIPPSVSELLPDGIFSQEAGEISDAVGEMSSFSYLLRTVLSLIGLEIHACLQLLALICGILLLAAVCRTLRASFLRDAVGRAFSFCTTLVILISLIAVGYENILAVTDYFSTLNGLTAALLPLTGALYAMGGNVSAAVASSAGLSVFMTVLEELVGKTIVPFCGLCLAFATVGALEPSLRTGTLLSTVKKNYSTALTFLMMLLLAMLTMQNTLGARADTLAMRSAKFALGNMIPVVGGSVSELFRSVSAGVSYLRGTLGICAVLLLLLTLFPTLIKLFLIRLTWQICASFADLLGCDSEKKLLEEFASLGGYLIAAVSICSSVLLLSLTLLIRCASAIG